MKANERLLRNVVSKTICEKYETLDMKYHLWDWQEGVGMYGIYKAYQYTKDSSYIKFLIDWIEEIKDQALLNKNINTTAPMLTVLELYKLTGKPEYKMLCENMASYCMAEASRTVEGTLAHTVIGKAFANQIWADTLFMGALFLAKWGQYTGDMMYLKEASRQLILHYKYLIDPKTSLMFHGYDAEKKNHLSSVLWGRANGWGVISSVEILDTLPDYFEEKKIITMNLQEHVLAIVKYQNNNGSWNTVLNDKKSYEETTAIATFYYGIKKGLQKGYVKGNFEVNCELAYKALLNYIKEDGEVLGTSGGTPIMKTAEEYNQIPCVMSYYGQGLTMMALI